MTGAHERDLGENAWQRGIGRRRFIGGSAALAASAATIAGAESARAVSTQPTIAAAQDGTARVTTIAMVTDVHINQEDPEPGRRFVATMEAIEAENPDLIIDCGDQTDHGDRGALEDYRAMVPAALRDRLHLVPGNHEERFDWSAKETWRSVLGASSSTVTVDGLQVILFDTSTVQQVQAFASDDDLSWLREQLERGGRDQPSIIVSHHPLVGEGMYFMAREQALLDVVDRYKVRAVLTGHVHQEIIRRCNGLTLFTGKDNKRHAGFYRLVRTVTPTSDLLDVTYVAVPDPTDPSAPVGETPVLTIDLGDPGPGENVRTVHTRARVEEGQVAISAVVPTRSAVAGVAATIYAPFVFFARHDDTWTELEQRGATYTGSIPLGDLPAGAYRVIVRVTDEEGNQWRETTELDYPGPALAPLWHDEVDGSIHGAMAQLAGMVVAASVTGAVVGYRPTRKHAGQVWSRQLGPVYTSPAFAPDATAVYLPSADHRLHALHPDDGRTLWSTDLAAPVVCDPLVAEIGGASRVVVAAGLRMWCLDATTGTVVWQLDLPKLSAGRPATDGERVFFGCGDGAGWCVDGSTGGLIWRTVVTSGKKAKEPQDAPWTTDVLLLAGVAIIQTRNLAVALDQGTGALVWKMSGDFGFCTPAAVGASAILVEGVGTARRVDAATGTVLWSVPTGPNIDNPAVLIHEGHAILTSSNAMVYRVDVADGSVELLRHVSNAMVLSTPAVVEEEGLLIVGDQDGVVRAFDLSAR